MKATRNHLWKEFVIRCPVRRDMELRIPIGCRLRITLPSEKTSESETPFQVLKGSRGVGLQLVVTGGGKGSWDEPQTKSKKGSKVWWRLQGRSEVVKGLVRRPIETIKNRHVAHANESIVTSGEQRIRSETTMQLHFLTCL